MRILLVIIAISMLSTSATAADWPMFRNDAGNTGESSETINLPLTEQWHSSAPHVEENGAVVSNGIVYMSSEDGKLYAFVVATGESVTGFPVNTAGNYGTPAVDTANQKVYVLAGSSLLAFNLDGTTAWSDNVGSVGFNLNVGPIIDGGYVYVKAGGNLRKYNNNGGLQWSSPSSGTNTQPSIMGDYVYTNSESGQIRKYNKATGVEIIGGGFPINTITSAHGVPTTKDGKIFFVHGQVYAYDADSGSLAWSKPASLDTWGYNRPAVSNGVVYIYGGDGKIYAFDENTGATMAGFPSISLNPSGDRNWGSPAIAGDKIFIGAGTTQKLKVLGAAGTANAGLVLAEHLTFSTDFQGFDLCSPVISDGVVFAMLDGGGLYAFFDSDTPWTGGGIKIEDGAECTESQEVTLSLDRGSNDLVNEMIISEDPFFSGATWEPYSTTRTWTLSAGFGMKTVYVQFRDPSGLLSNVFNDQIDYSENCGGEILPGIDIEKWTNGEDADTPTGPNIPVGDPVNWEYIITNIGNVPLTDIVVTDDQGVTVSCPASTLDIDASMTCTASGMAEPGQYANLGTVTANGECIPVSDEDLSHYFGVATGCTLTQGYWKTHSIYAKAHKYDDTWASIGEDTPFFGTVDSWYDTLCTNPEGSNVYYILAHQYIAAKLNHEAGASTSVISSELIEAETLLGDYGPLDDIEGELRNNFLRIAEKLDQYNNGIIGPGHCED